MSKSVWSDRAGKALEKIYAGKTLTLTVDKDDVEALRHCRDGGYEPYYTLKCLIVKLEGSD